MEDDEQTRSNDGGALLRLRDRGAFFLPRTHMHLAGILIGIELKHIRTQSLLLEYGYLMPCSND